MDRGDGEACFAVITVLEYARSVGCLPLIIDTPLLSSTTNRTL